MFYISLVSLLAKESKLQYFSEATHGAIPTLYIKTRSFLTIEENLLHLLNSNSNENLLILRGPKGVGKSMCLVALYCSLQMSGNIDALFVSNKCLDSSSPVMRQYYLDQIQQ